MSFKWFTDFINSIVNAFKSSKKTVPVVPSSDSTGPLIVIPATNDTESKPVLCGCDVSTPLVDGPYDASYMSSNANFEECHIEPSTGLMVRYAVWIPSQNNFWLQSSVGEGHVKRDGSNLVADCHDFKGFRYHVRGFCNYEPQTHEKEPKLCAVGNTCPYDGSRLYVIVECRKV